MTSTNDAGDNFNLWMRRLQIGQSLTIGWLLCVQTASWNLQGMSEASVQLLASSGALLLQLFLTLPRFPVNASVRGTWLRLSTELVLIGIATTFGTVSGFQFLLIMWLGKAALLLDKRCHLMAAALLTFFVFLTCAVPNQQLFVQSTQGFRQTEGLLSALFSRELLPWLLFGSLAIITARSVKTEIVIRHQLEALADKLEALSADVERHRIADEINSSVMSLVAQTRDCVDTLIAEPEKETATRIEQAREVATQALTQVRQSLKVLRS